MDHKNKEDDIHHRLPKRSSDPLILPSIFSFFLLCSFFFVVPYYYILHRHLFQFYNIMSIERRSIMAAVIAATATASKPTATATATAVQGGAGVGGGETWECDYDKNPTSLYEAIEEKAWVAGLHFFKTGQWEKGMFFSPVTDPITPQRQARTWVTRFQDEDGKVRWSQLPIHAALIFGAPFQFVQELVKIFPQGVKCTDDQHMLPLHLAFKFGAEDNVVACLLEAFPESIFTKDIRGRLPTEVESTTASVRKERSKIIEQIIAVMAKTSFRRHGEAMNKTFAQVQEDLILQNNLNAQLELEKQDLNSKYEKSQVDIKQLQSQLKELQVVIATKEREEKKLQSKIEDLKLVVTSKVQQEQMARKAKQARAQEEQEAREREEQERKAREREEQERKAHEEQERAVAAAAALALREEKKRVAREREEQQRKAREREEQERKAREEQERAAAAAAAAAALAKRVAREREEKELRERLALLEQEEREEAVEMQDDATSQEEEVNVNNASKPTSSSSVRGSRRPIVVAHIGGTKKPKSTKTTISIGEASVVSIGGKKVRRRGLFGRGLTAKE